MKPYPKIMTYNKDNRLKIWMTGGNKFGGGIGMVIACPPMGDNFVGQVVSILNLSVFEDSEEILEEFEGFRFILENGEEKVFPQGIENDIMYTKL